MDTRKELKTLGWIIAVFAFVFFMPIADPRFRTAIDATLDLAQWYAQEHVILCLLPAFFIAGTISVFVSQGAVIRYFGANAKRWLSYTVAALSGGILAVCSCTILPLFTSIYKRGAGLGPAIAFLYSGPAISILSIILTARILGMELGIARILDSLDSLDSEARQSLQQSSGTSDRTLYGLSIGPFLNVKLSYTRPGSEEVETVDFDSDLDMVERTSGGPFAAIVLLSSDDWDPELVVSGLRSEWGIDLGDAEIGEDTMIATVGGDIVAVSLIRSRVPGEEAEENASNNYLWPGAVDAARSHRAHLVVALVNHGGDPLDCGLTFTKLLTSCARLPNAVGVYHCGTVFEPSSYVDSAQAMKSGELPLEDMVWFGMYRTSEGINAYTVGMTFYGRDEMEVIAAKDQPFRVAAFLYDVAYHVLYNGTGLRDGDTIGFSEDQVLTVRKSPGVSVDGQTLKIEYPDSNGNDTE